MSSCCSGRKNMVDNLCIWFPNGLIIDATVLDELPRYKTKAGTKVPSLF